MKAAVFSDYGDVDVLRVADVPAPTAGPEQVRLAVRCAGVNPLDWKVLSGDAVAWMPLELPAVLGTDVAGVVDQVGRGVSEFAVGDEVFGKALTGSFAELTLADQSELVTRPPALPWAMAAIIPFAGFTAWTALRQLRISRGDTILIHAAAGGVGVIATQLAVARGARVIGTSRPANHEFLASIGAIPVAYGRGLAERVRSAAGGRIDAVLDGSGRGELLMSVELAGGTDRVLTLAAPDAQEHGVAYHVPDTTDFKPALHEILALVGTGQLRVPISRTYPLVDVAAALAEVRAGHTRGKIVVEV